MKKISNIFKKLKGRKKKPHFKKEKESSCFKPVQVWHMLLKGALGFVVFMLLINLFFFFRFSNANKNTFAEDIDIERPSLETVNRPKLRTILNRYEEKSLQFEILQEEKPSIGGLVN